MKISESIEFITQIHASWDGREQRVSLRLRPRRSIAYDYIGMEAWQSQYLRGLSYSQQTQLIQMPLWHAACRSKEDINYRRTRVNVEESSLWHYRGCGSLMLWQSDQKGGSVLEIDRMIPGGRIDLKKELLESWKRGSTAIMPVAWGTLSRSDQYLNQTGAISSMTLHVELMREAQAPPLPEALDENHDEKTRVRWGKNLPRYDDAGVEVFLFPGAWLDDIKADFSRNAYRLDNQTGVFRYDLRGVDPIETREIGYVLKTRAEMNNLQRFFYRCRGRQKSFYAPTWVRDVDLAMDAAAGAKEVLATWPLYWKYFNASRRRKTLIVFYRDYTADILKVAGYSTDETGRFGKIILEEPLRRRLHKADCLMISFFCRYRLDTDIMTINYETPEAATTTLPIKEALE